MLVRDPAKRYSIRQIKAHAWLADTGDAQASGGDGKADPSEQILRLMQSLGIDAKKTREVRIDFDLFCILVSSRSGARRSLQSN